MVVHLSAFSLGWIRSGHLLASVVDTERRRRTAAFKDWLMAALPHDHKEAMTATQISWRMAACFICTE